MEPSRLGQILVSEGLISDEQLEEALRESRENGTPLLHVLVEHKHLEEETIANFLAHQYGMETVDLGTTKPSPQAHNLIPPELARRCRLVPLTYDNMLLRIAVENPADEEFERTRPNIRIPQGNKLEFVVAPISQMREAISSLYPATANARSSPARSGEIIVFDAGEMSVMPQKREEKPLEELNPEELMTQMQDSVEVTGEDGGGEEFSVEAANEEPVKRMCNYIIAEAVKRRASDIHINPTSRGITFRLRIDGTLQVMPSPPPSMKNALIARFKVMANMNITERRRPQDGRIKIKVIDKTIDMRVSVIPQMDGENIVMRILDQSSLQFDLTKLGFEPMEMQTYNEAIRSPYGLILHTGPTGSGKTTTLYSALSAIYDPKKSFVTLEDPVEYEMANVVQIQMDNDVGLDFATALRSALRQDPNVMMVGEIRDKETARTAISASLTGHVLFSTLHTNDAPGTIARLIDLGIEPAYVGTAVRLIVAQRLMKRVCNDCKVPTAPTPDDLKKIEITLDSLGGGEFVKGQGCARCNMTGYKGRLGIYEMMKNTREIQEMIYEKADTMSLRKVAEEQGMRSLRSLALTKWKSGMTTADEVMRVTMGGD